MKIIQPSAQLIDAVDTAAVYAKLERCGRVSRKSEPKGNPEEFIRGIIKRGHESVLEHVSLTFHIICDRAVMAELTRHRLAAFTVESSRYVKYGELAVVAPPLTTVHDEIAFRNFIRDTEKLYSCEVQLGTPPEEARAVLPMCLATELYMTANLRELRHILKLRTDKAAQPQMREVAGQILQTLREKLPVIVEDI